jgi:phage terminase small subunit
LLQGVASGLNVSEAGRAAGYSNAQSAHRSLHRIRLQLPEILEKMNVPVEKVIKKLSSKMEAKETLHFTHQGIVMETRHVEAHAVQLRAAVELAKIIGLYPSVINAADESEAEKKVPGIQLTFVVGTPEEAKALGAPFINPRTDIKQLTAGVDASEDVRRRPGPIPEL